jgi:hypothetical protein
VNVKKMKSILNASLKSKPELVK